MSSFSAILFSSSNNSIIARRERARKQALHKRRLHAIRRGNEHRSGTADSSASNQTPYDTGILQGTKPPEAPTLAPSRVRGRSARKKVGAGTSSSEQAQNKENSPGQTNTSCEQVDEQHQGEQKIALGHDGLLIPVMNGIQAQDAIQRETQRGGENMNDEESSDEEDDHALGDFSSPSPCPLIDSILQIETCPF